MLIRALTFKIFFYFWQAYGGFLLLDAAGNVLGTQPVGENTGIGGLSLHFEVWGLGFRV